MIVGLVSVGMFASACTVGGADAVDGGAGSDPFACVRNSDCPAPLVCRASASGSKTCVPQCRGDADCCADPGVPCGLVCRGEQCIAGDPETCNGRDDDADGMTDEGFFLTSDAANCGRCGLRCDAALAHARSRGTTCQDGVCRLNADGCADGFSNVNGTDADGCEYACTVTNNGVEQPDDDDNDCDGTTDEGFACVAGMARTCGLADPTRHGVGICRSGLQTCAADGTWGACSGATPPLLTESCNMLDDDCDGATDEDFFVGVACRGVGACGIGRYECNGPNANRCSTDIGGSAYPIPPPLETCDFVDNDCDGTVDLDADPAVVANDAWNCGACGVSCATPNAMTACVAGVCTVTGCATGFLLVGGACARCDVWPTVAEACDAAALDEDCDGSRNEGCACVNGTSQPCGLDPALHGVGVCHRGAQTCAGGQWGACSGAVAPTAEVCNRRDDDCDGRIPAEEADADGDGFAVCEGDCDDTDVLVRPSAAESCNMLDDDCDGTTDEGHNVGAPCNTGSLFGAACAGGTIECSANPAAPTRCSTSPGGSDYPATPPTETCDNLTDDDCDGSVDEGCSECVPSVQRPCGVAHALHNIGICRVGVQVCNAGRTWDPCGGATPPLPAESCNGADDDCDGTTDEGFDFTSDHAYCGGCFGNCTLLPNVAAASCAAGTCGGVVCALGFRDLNASASDGCEYACFPTFNGVERCDGLDNDCDGETDEAATCAPPPPNAPMTFSVTLAAGFTVDATAMFCATFVEGFWSCGGYPLTVTVDVGTGATTMTTSGAAIAGNHEFGLCTARCDTAIGVWVVVEDAGGLLVEAAAPAMTYAGASVPTNLGRNGRGGGHWVARFSSP